MIKEEVRFNIHQGMTCGSEEAEKRCYKLLRGTSGRRWLVALQPNEADNVYVEGEVGSDGFGGRVLTFKLADGSELKLKGPWHGNSDALYADTGYDCRHKCFTRGIVALRCEREGLSRNGDIYSEVLHYDDELTLGEFSRIEQMAQAKADELGRTVYYASVSSGGGCSGSKEPRR